jgi:FdhD protein
MLNTQTMEMEEQEMVATRQVFVAKVVYGATETQTDTLSVEEPLEINISYGQMLDRVQKSISVTMCTPGNDKELAVGFLFTEGIIGSHSHVKDVYYRNIGTSPQKNHIIQVELAEDFLPNLMQADRNFHATSSCGVCGKASIQAIRTVSPFQHVNNPQIVLSPDLLYQLPDRLRKAQDSFSITGGMHASGLFDEEGTLHRISEDVGRHNALDKLIGGALMDGLLPLDRYVLLLSGRVSFELVQKAAMAGIRVVAAIGAPSSLAVELAKELDISLVGFLKAGRFNIYHLSTNLQIQPSHENKD